MNAPVRCLVFGRPGWLHGDMGGLSVVTTEAGTRMLVHPDSVQTDLDQTPTEGGTHGREGQGARG